MKKFDYTDHSFFYDEHDYSQPYGFFHISFKRHVLCRYSRKSSSHDYKKIILLFIPLLKQ